MAAADPRRKDVEEGEAWKKDAARSSSASNYDRGERQALAFSRVVNQWNPLLEDGRTEQHQRLRPRSERQRRLSNKDVAKVIGRHIDSGWYWPNDVQRAYDGELRMSHLRPEIVEAYCIALEHTDLDSMTEAFFAAELKPPKVTKDALKLAIRVSEGGADSGRRSA